MTTKRIGIAVVVVLLTANLFVAVRLYSEATGKVEKDNPYAQMELITRVM